MKKVNVFVEKWTIPTYPLPETEEMPMFAEKRNHQGTTGNPYPNRVVQRVESTVKVDKEYDIVRLENDYIRVSVIPELGGKVFEAYDKINDYNFLYRQHVIKPALIGAFGAWTSGGLEFNWPYHHRPSTCMPVDFTLEECADGSAICWLSEAAPTDRTKSLIGIVLRPDTNYFETRVKVTNRTDTLHQFLWWENGAVHINDSYRIIYPPDVTWVHYHYDKSHTTYPIATGRYFNTIYSEPTDISWLKNSSDPASYFAAPSKYDFFGGYDYSVDCGTIHIADHFKSAGKKMFTWGTGEFGENWQNNLTDSDGKYCELMAGSYSDDQPDFTWIEPYETKTFSQFWYPVRKTQMVDFANLNGAVALDKETGKVRINVTKEVNDAKIVVTEANTGIILADHSFSLKPCDCKEYDIKYSNELLLVQVFDTNGVALLSYAEEIPDNIHIPKDNLGIPTPDHLHTAQDCYLAGVHIDLYRDPIYKPDVYYLEALKYDPNHLLSLSAIGEYYLRNGDFEKAKNYLNRAMAVQNPYDNNPKDGTVGYLLGLTLLRNGEVDKAYDTLFKSAWSCNTISKAMTLIAAIDSGKGQYDKMLQHADEALDKESHNPLAGAYAAWALYKLGRIDEAKERINKILEYDCLNQLARYMKIKIMGKSLSELFDCFKMNSNPSQTCLDMVFDLNRAGLTDEAIEVLFGLEEYRGASTMALYSLGVLLYERGDKEKAASVFDKATKNPIVDVFPSRVDEQYILKKAIDIYPHDGTAYYLLGCLYYYEKQYEKAAECWLKSVDLSPDFYIPYRNLAVAYYSHLGRPVEAFTYLKKAIDIKPDEQLLNEAGFLMAAIGIPAEERINYLKDRIPSDCGDDFVLELTRAYLSAGKHDDALQIMLGHIFTPGEGGELYIAETYLFSRFAPGRIALAARDANKALKLFNDAMILPENLHVGYGNNALLLPVKYYQTMALKDLGKEEQAQAIIDSVIGMDDDIVRNTGGEYIYYAAMFKKLSGNTAAADQMIRNAILSWEEELADENYPGMHLKKGRFFYQSFIDNPMAMKQADLYYMLGYGMLYLGKKDEAKANFEKSLSFNPDNIKAALELQLL